MARANPRRPITVARCRSGGRLCAKLLLEEVEAALDELPAGQRDAFVAHKLEGRSFRELAAEMGLSINTLLSRKRYAVLHLRERLRGIYEDFMKTGGPEK